MMAYVRKVNMLLGMVLALALLAQGVLTGLALFGWTSGGFLLPFEIVLYIYFGVGLCMAVPSVVAGLRTRRWYPRQNVRYWVGHVSGFLALICAVWLQNAIRGDTSGHLIPLMTLPLVGLFLGVIFVAAHLCVQQKGVLLALGFSNSKTAGRMIMTLVLSVASFFLASVVVYAVRGAAV